MLRVRRPAGWRNANPVCVLSFAALSLCVLTVGPGCDATKKDKAKVESRSPRESLKPMPWYDKKRDDYKQYSAEEVRKYIRKPRERREPSRSWLNLGPGFGQLLIYAIGALLVGLLIFFLVRLWKERTPVRKKTVIPGSVEHEEVLGSFDDESAAVLEEDALAAQIEAALQAGELRRAAVYIFIYALLRLARSEKIHLRPGRTARDYLRRLRRNKQVEPGEVELFAAATREFEIALYRGSAPEEDLRQIWQGLRATGGNA